MAPAADASLRTPKPHSQGKGTVPTTARGVGLTPRLFNELLCTKDATFGALPSLYVSTIHTHVQSVQPSLQVMAQNYVPVVVENEGGGRRVLHVDPLAVRKFRRTVAEELRDVREKRERFLQRMKDLRQELPRPRDLDVAQALEKEIANAEAQVNERLLRPISSSTRSLQLVVEVSPNMVQLGLVCELLQQELAAALVAAGCERVSTATVGASLRARGERPPAPLEGATPLEAEAWLRSLAAFAAAGSSSPRKGEDTTTSTFRLAPALRRAGAANANVGNHLLLVVACSPPSDLDVCIALLDEQPVLLQVVGVFGACPEDPEPFLQELADRAAEGSLHLFFGAEYWSKFAATQRKRLQRLRKRIEERRKVYGPEREDEDGDVVSSKVFEVRLIERIMRECYVEEQHCEEELRCAGRLLDRTLVSAEEVAAVLQSQAQGPKSGP